MNQATADGNAFHFCIAGIQADNAARHITDVASFERNVLEEVRITDFDQELRTSIADNIRSLERKLTHRQFRHLPVHHIAGNI